MQIVTDKVRTIDGPPMERITGAQSKRLEKETITEAKKIGIMIGNKEIMGEIDKKYRMNLLGKID